MQRTDEATSAIRASNDRFGRARLTAARTGLAILAGLVVFSVSRAQTPTTQPVAGGSDQNRVLLQLLNQVETLGRQVRELRGQVESASNRVDQAYDRATKAEKRQSDLYNDTDARMRQLEKSEKDDTAERKRLLAQMGDFELRLRKLEADIDVQMKKLQAEVDAKLRKTDTASAGTTQGPSEQLTQIEARLTKLEAANGQSGPSAADLDARLRRLEQAAAAGPSAAVRANTEVPPGSANTPVVQRPNIPAVTQTPSPAVPSVPQEKADAVPSSLPPASLNSPPDPDVVSRAYERALNKQRAGDSAGAVQDFQAFLRSYPNHELAPNAQYWLGEAYLRLGDYKNAIAGEEKLLATYPDHLKVPDAMLILASAQYADGDVKTAHQTLEELIAKYPLSEAADKAKQRLAKFR